MRQSEEQSNDSHKNLISWTLMSPDIWSNVFAFLKTKDLINNIQVSRSHYQAGKLLGQSRLWQSVRKHFFYKPIETEIIGVCNGPTAFAKLSDNQMIVGDSHGGLGIWRRNEEGEWNCIADNNMQRAIFSIAVMDDQHFAIASADRTLHIWRFNEELCCIALLNGHTHWLTSVLFLKNGHLVSGSLDGTLRIWEKQNDIWECIAILDTEVFEFIISVIALPDGRLVSSTNNLIHVWQERDGIWENIILSGHSREVESVIALPNGNLVSTSWDSMLIWQEHNGNWETIFVNENFLQGNSGVFLTLLSSGQLICVINDVMLRFFNPRNDGSFDASLTYEFASEITSLCVITPEEIWVGSDTTINSLKLNPFLGLSCEFENRPG